MFYEGDMTINGQTVDLSGTSVFDLLDAGDLRFPPLVNYFEARKGRWGGYLDTTLLGLEFGASDISLGPGPATAAFSLDFTYALIHAGLIYTAAEWAQQNGTVAFDLLGGVRYTYYDMDLRAAIGPIPVSFADTLDWWDVTLGARLRGQTDNGWNWALRGDIAGAGLESDFSVQAVASFGRDFRLGRVDLSWIAGDGALGLFRGGARPGPGRGIWRHGDHALPVGRAQGPAARALRGPARSPQNT